MPALAVLLLALAPEAALSRLSEEAEMFRQAASQAIAEEVLIHTAGTRAVEVVSEYSLATLKDGFLHEVRQVTSVNGRQVRNQAKARRTLIRGLTSPDDRTRKSLLDDFRRYKVYAAVEVAPLILLFTRRHLAEYRFEPAGEARIGADSVRVFRYRQVAGSQSVLVIQERQAVHHPLEGEIFCRATDGLPLRITMRADREEKNGRFRDEIAVDYVMTAHGFLAPASAVHRAYANGRLDVQNLYRYSRFQRFAASTEIKFSEVPEVK